MGFMEREGKRKESPWRKRRKHKQVSGRKDSTGGSKNSRFHSKFGLTGNWKGGWKTKGPLLR